MTTITKHAKVDANGNVVVPVGRGEVGRDVVVTIAPARPAMSQEDWEKFIDSTAGSIDDPTFERPPQGEYEKREPLE